MKRCERWWLGVLGGAAVTWGLLCGALAAAPAVDAGALRGVASLWDLLAPRGDEATRRDRARGRTELRVNGVEVEASVEQHREPVAVFAQAIEERCRRGQAPPQGGSTGAALLDALWRREHIQRWRSDDELWIACFDAGVRPLDGGSYLEALLDADFAPLLPTRVVALRPTAAGGTSSLTVRLRNALPLNEMFPEGADAPGADIPGTPRPQGVRWLSVQLQGERSGHLTVYRVARGPSVALERYQRRLRAMEIGARPLAARRPGEEGGAALRGLRIDLAGGRTVVATAVSDGGGALLTLAELPR